MGLILGVFEKVDFPQFNLKGITAKLDTGAYTGALHCTNIRLDATGAKKTLHFTPVDGSGGEIVTEHFSVKSVKSSNGETQNRFFIETAIVIKGHEYPISISLTDRSEMKWPAIIGRRFFYDNKILVDANQINK